MKRPNNYNTKQREAILDYIISMEGTHLTAARIVEHLDKEKVRIGRTTVFRQLDKLVKNEVLRRYTVDGISGACYQYIDNTENCRVHFHLKCEDCGKLTHLECETLLHLHQHVLDEHSFKINNLKTVLYGKCNNCRNEKTRDETNV